MSVRELFARMGFGFRSFLLLLAVMLPAAASAKGLRFPAVGPYNGYLGHLNVVECTNSGTSPVHFSLTLVRNDGSIIGSVERDAAAQGGAVHTILNDLRDSGGRGIENDYGVYVIVPTTSADGLRCLSTFYRRNGAELEYAFAIPLEDPLTGETYGLYNSYDPSGLGIRPTQNWLSIFNPDTARTFSASVIVRNMIGSFERIERVELAPFERKDIALGHDTGSETTGLYSIVPDESDEAYGSFLSRYGSTDGSQFNFAFALPSVRGTCGDQLFLSSMADADNWLVLANPSGSEKQLSLRVQDRFGKELRRSVVALEPFSQNHTFLNPIIDPDDHGDVGSATIDCDSSADRLLIQTAFYGRERRNPLAVGWAYSVVPAGIAPGSELSASVNTFLGASNWLKLANSASSNNAFNLKLSGAGESGSFSVSDSQSVNAFGTNDIAVHELVGANYVGTATIQAAAGSKLSGQLLRVFPASDGEVSYIMATPASVLESGSGSSGGGSGGGSGSGSGGSGGNGGTGGTGSNGGNSGNPPVPDTSLRINGFSLINVDTNLPIAGYNPIPSNAVIDTTKLATNRLNIRANVAGNIGSVSFTINGAVVRTENIAPFSVGGDTNGQFEEWAYSPGNYQLTATPFAAANGSGAKGTAATLSFKIVTSTGTGGGGSGGGGSNPGTKFNVPRGYYLLRPVTGAISLPDTILKNPYLSGIVIRARWADVNPSKGVYDWQRIKDAASKITAAGKHWKLKIFTGTGDPDWLKNEGVKYFTFKNTNVQDSHPDASYSIPVPWDPKMLELYDALLAAAAKEFDGSPNLDLFAIGGPTRFSLEMHLPAEVQTIAGYAPSKITSAWRQSIDSFARHFKTTMGEVDLGNPLPGSTEAEKVTTDVSAYVFTVLGNRGAVQHDSYNAKDTVESYWVHQLVVAEGSRGHTFGFEQVASSADTTRYGGTFASSVQRACGYDTDYFDIYTPDDASLKQTFCGRAGGAGTGTTGGGGTSNPTPTDPYDISPGAAPPAVSSDVKSGYEGFTFTANGVSLPYRLARPVNYNHSKPYPLVVVLHGTGQNGSDNLSTLNMTSSKAFRDNGTAFVLVPHAAEPGWVDVPDTSTINVQPQLLAVEKLIRKLMSQFNIDRDRIYITGQSRGGIGTYSLITTFPTLFAAAMPVAGAGDPAQADKIVKLPFSAFHGLSDPTVPITYMQQIVARLKSLGSTATLTTFQAGHNVWDRVYSDPANINWLLKQTRPK